MKRITRHLLLLLLTVFLVLPVCACSGKTTDDKTTLWDNATYQSDKEFGQGAKTITVEVKVKENAVKFTIHTDAETVGSALLEHNLISGEEGEYGLYVKVVNGIRADYDTDQSYWTFYINDETAMTGVDQTDITEGDAYSLVYTK